MASRVSGEEIGIVASGATAVYAPVLINKRWEPKVADEQLVVIHDPTYEDIAFLGVLRRVTRYEPFIREGVRSSYVDFPELIDRTSLMDFSNALVHIYGMLRDDGGGRRFDEPKTPPHPGSKVYLVENGEPLTEYLMSRVGSEGAISVGEHKYTKWRFPLDPKYLNCHLGVFGATGVGKSRLIRALIDEIVERTEYSLIVFDHTGIDYAPHYKDKTIPSNRISISPPVIASIICDLARLTWSTYGEYMEIACIEYVTERPRASQTTLTGGRVEAKLWSKQRFLEVLSSVMSSLNARPQTIRKARLFIEHFIPSEFFDELNVRDIPPSSIIERALNDGLVVVDLSGDRELIVKQAIVRDVIEEAWKRVKEIQKPINLGIVIDEAQNYAGEAWSLCGDLIETTAREGRKWNLFIVLASQRVARDVRPSIRANLGSVFFSKLQATGDLKEIGGYLDVSGVSEALLSQLGAREFYVAGLINPMRRPILLRVREVR